MPMKSPLHPGRIVKHECLEPLNLTVKRAAEILGVTRQALNNIVNEEAAISADMAIRLEKAFGEARTPGCRCRTITTSPVLAVTRIN